MSKARNLQWKQLPSDEAIAFISAVASVDEATVFDLSLCEVHRTPLGFYDGYFLYRIVNRHMLPYLFLDYLSNGEKHYYMDGSDQAFHNLNSQGAISLDVDNARDYVDLYISYVYERGSSLSFISNPYNTQYKGTAAMDIHFKAIMHHQDSSVKFNDSSQRFEIVAPLIYQDQTVQSLIEVEKSGAIHVVKPITVSFLSTLRPIKDIPYRHPDEVKIIEQAHNLLTSSQRGADLFKTVSEQPFELRVLSSPNYQGFTTNNRIIYIVMPGAQTTADYMQALVMAGCLRDVEQMTEKLFHPHPGVDEDVYALMNYGKNLDIIVEMCKIVEEFESKNVFEPLHELRKMGLEPMYSGYKNKMNEQALMATYMDMLERYGLIKR